MVYLKLILDALIGILDSPLSFIFSFLFTLSFVLFYLDDFKLSDLNFIKYIQIFSFICIPLCSIYIYYLYGIIDVNILCVDDKDVNLHGHVSVDKEAGKAIGEGISTIGSNIGLGASVAGLGGAVAKGVAKGSLPPLQKAGIIIAGGAIGGVIHIAATAINRNATMSSVSVSSVSGSTVNKSLNNVNKLMDLGDSTSPMEILLQCIIVLSYISTFLLFILSIQLFYKFYISDKPQLKWIDFLFSSYNSEKIKILIYKAIKLNKNMSMIYVIIIVIMLAISAYTLCYISLELFNNLDKYVSVYINLKK